MGNPPFSGRISERNIAAFQDVSPGQHAFTVVGVQGLKVRALVPETLARSVKQGDVVTVSLPSAPGTVFSASVSDIGAVAEAGAAIPVYAVLEESALSGNDISVGLAASIAFPVALGDSLKVLFVPLSALAMNEIAQLSEGGGNTGQAPLFLFNGDKGIVERRLVGVAALKGNMLAVQSGLAVGDEVVIAGTSFLKDGMRVRRWEPETPKEEVNFTPLDFEVLFREKD